MGRMPPKIKIANLKPGDHIYARRMGGLYAHHGIYIGQETVIHFIPEKRGKISLASAVSSGDCGGKCVKCGFSPENGGGIVKTCLDCFLKGHRHHVYVFPYGIWFFYGIKWRTRLISLPAEQVVQRATELYEKKTTFGVYHVWANNCEHFAFYCKSDTRLSKQITSLIGPIAREITIIHLSRKKKSYYKSPTSLS